MLTLPNARVEVKIRSVPHALNSRAEERGDGLTTALEDWPEREKQLEMRDWRELRTRLIGLQFDETSRSRHEIATWLNDAGYAPVLQGPPTKQRMPRNCLSV